MIRARKGQTRVIGEMLIFAIGVLIVGYVLIIFSNTQNNINQLSVQDQLTSIAKFVKESIVSVVESGGEEAVIKFETPAKASNREYVIELKNNQLLVYIFDNPEIKITEGLFNIGNEYTIENVMFTGSAKYLLLNLTREGDTKMIKLERDVVV